jgi:hypothetical protein
LCPAVRDRSGSPDYGNLASEHNIQSRDSAVNDGGRRRRAIGSRRRAGITHSFVVRIDKHSMEPNRLESMSPRTRCARIDVRETGSIENPICREAHFLPFVTALDHFVIMQPEKAMRVKAIVT